LITRDELKRIFRLLRKHEDLLITAYLENSGVVDEAEEDIRAVESLISSRLLWRPDDSEAVRLTRELSGLFERILRDPRRLTVDADIGGVINNIENNINRYKDALRSGSRDDVNHYQGQVERLVDDLRCSLLDSSGHLWQKINSEFGYVTSLDLKIKENEVVLKQAKRLNDSLELIKVPEMDEMAGSDPHLRRYLHRWLLASVELCRRETVDAMHKLNELLFEYRKQQRLGCLIDAFYRRYQSSPGYIPLDYTEMGEIPSVFNQVTPVSLTGQPDIIDPQQELVLTEIITGLRKEHVAIEEPEVLELIGVQPVEPPIEILLSPLRQAVENFYLMAVDADQPLSAVDYRPSDDIESDIELWLYAIIARYNNMDESERILFEMTYQESTDPVFSGRLLVHDVSIRLRLDGDVVLNTRD